MVGPAAEELVACEVGGASEGEVFLGGSNKRVGGGSTGSGSWVLTLEGQRVN
jgi:hypothetical protein